jgi:hypothetical protein
MTKHQKSASIVIVPATINTTDLVRVTGGSGTWKDTWDGAGNTGYKGGKKWVRS